jgi:hypothetical protein
MSKNNKFGKEEYSISSIPEADKPSDPIIREAFDQIWKKIQKTIYFWSEFKTELPFEQELSRSQGSAESIEYDHTQDLYTMCYDEQGKRKSLDTKQQKEIAESAQFTVKSSIEKKFDNVWKLGSFLQLGRQEIARRFQHRKEAANRHWYLYLPEQLFSHQPLSFKQGFVSIKNSARHLLGILIGLQQCRPRYHDGSIGRLLKKYNISYLFNLLTPDREDERIWKSDDGLKLNLLLADPKCRKSILDIIDEAQEQLTERGDMSDTSMLNAIINHPKCTKIHEDLPGLIERLHSLHYLLSRNNPDYQQQFSELAEERKNQLIIKHPLRGRYQSWLDEQLFSMQAEIDSQIMENLTSKLDQSLPPGQEKYCLVRNRLFKNMHEREIRQRLSKKFRISNLYKITRFKWSFASPEHIDKLDTNVTRITTLRPLWRLHYLWTYGVCVFSNSCLRFIRSLLYNPLGYKSVFTTSKDQFFGEQWIDNTGKIIGCKFYNTHITDIYKQLDIIKRYRNEFENKSDYGLFPRSIGRLFNQIYCYLLIGAIGISLSLLIRYIGFLALSLITIAGLLLAPLWVPLYIMLSYLYSLFIVDWLGPDIYYNKRKLLPYSSTFPLLMTVVYHFIFRGVLMLVISLLIILFHALATPVLHGFALTLYVLRTAWDGLMRLILIKPFAKIPGANFHGLITRISGYGIASEVLNTVSQESALKIYNNWLELFILDKYKSVLISTLNQPKDRLKEMMSPVYSSIVGHRIYPIQEKLEENINELENAFKSNYNTYRKMLMQAINTESMQFIRLPKAELMEFTNKAEDLTAERLESKLFSYMREGDVTAFWFKLGVQQNDWPLLNRKLLQLAFSADILTAIEDCDASISVMNTNKSTLHNLLTDKEPSSKVQFVVTAHNSTPSTAEFSFLRNSFWSDLYSEWYLPIVTEEHWKYVGRLRDRMLN